MYEVAGWALFAPTGWTGSGMVGADGSRSAQLSYQNEAMSAVSYTSYGSVANAAPYFPSLRKSWNSAGYPGPEPSAIPGLRETALTSDFVRYSLPASTAGLFTDGIIFNGVASKGCTPTVVQFEIMLTAADHDLAGAILNRAYVAVLQPMLKTCNYKAPDPSTVR
ncbi:MAG TPA: hypothetical protein VEJ20_09010 [Candidatus Eremiobacteraceae bacterium]|nr:hypothetical protein [Candidatus Eremiobacteraceae bacterium]